MDFMKTEFVKRLVVELILVMKKKGIKVAEVAKAMKVAPQAVRDWIKGNSPPNDHHAWELAAWLKDARKRKDVEKEPRLIKIREKDDHAKIWKALAEQDLRLRAIEKDRPGADNLPTQEN